MSTSALSRVFTIFMTHIAKSLSVEMIQQHFIINTKFKKKYFKFVNTKINFTVMTIYCPLNIKKELKLKVRVKVKFFKLK